MKKSIISGSMFVLLAAFGAGAATLSGEVTLSARGGADGSPIADAKVVLMGFSGGGGGVQQRLDSTTTNNQGRYSFSNVTTGFRQVVSSKTGYTNGQAFANVTTNNGTFTANIEMTASTGGGGGGDMGAVSGTIRAGSSTGTPILGATVTLSRSTGGVIDSMRTNALGHYTFDSVEARDNYVVRVSAAGYVSQSNSNVDVRGGDTAVVHFSLIVLPPPAKPGSIGGTVRKASSSEALARVVLVLSRLGVNVDTTTSNSNGQYTFDSVAANLNYTVTARLTGYQTAVNSDVDVVSNQTITVDIILIPSGPTPTRGNISGRVINTSSQTVAKARVLLSRPGSGGGLVPVDTTETDASGRFAFDSVSALQNYTVAVTAANYQIALNANVDVVAGQTVMADFILVPTGVGIRSDGVSESGFRLSGSLGSFSVEFPSSPWAGRLSVYDLRGALAHSTVVPAGTVRMSLPGKGGIRFMMLERGGMVERLSVPAR